MSRRARAVWVVVIGGIAGALVHLADGGGSADALVFLVGGLVIGELLVLRLEDGSAVPLSFAVMIVLAASFELDEYATAVLAAELVAFFVRPKDQAGSWRVEILLGRLLVAAATFAAYRGVRVLLDERETVPAVLAALGAAAAAQVVADALLRSALRIGQTFSVRGRLAWLAVASSGMLMAIGYRGVDGEGGVGIWGPLLFATPLLAAWYAFERLDAATRSFHQTIESLAMAPEFGGLVSPGHAQRVRTLALAMAGHLGLPAKDAEDLEMAALLHHLGEVTLEDPEVAGAPDPADVAAITGGMMREIRPLAAAGDIVSGDSEDPRRRVMVQVLRIASAYDDLTVGDGNSSRIAVETLRTEPAFVYEPRVVAALEAVVVDMAARRSREDRRTVRSGVRLH